MRCSNGDMLTGRWAWMIVRPLRASQKSPVGQAHAQRKPEDRPRQRPCRGPHRAATFQRDDRATSSRITAMNDPSTRYESARSNANATPARAQPARSARRGGRDRPFRPLRSARSDRRIARASRPSAMPSANGKKPGPGSADTAKGQQRRLRHEEDGGGQQGHRHEDFADGAKKQGAPRRPAPPRPMACAYRPSRGRSVATRTGLPTSWDRRPS